MLEIIKKFFKKPKQSNKDADSKLTSITETNELKKVADDFQKEYQEKLKNVKNSNDFHSFAVKMTVKRISCTDFGKHEEFLNEIKYFMHYLLLVLKDDYDFGDKICQQTLTQFDNYIFSVYRKRPELAENIRKITLLANSNRFTENPKENILSYFVFLEENGIELVQLLQDYADILDNKLNLKTGTVNPKKSQEKEKNDNSESPNSFKNLQSIAPSMQNFNRSLPKIFDRE